MRRLAWSPFAALGLVLMLGLCRPALAQTPAIDIRYLDLSDQRPFQTVTIRGDSDRTTRYRLLTREYRMQPNGKLQQLPDGQRPPYALSPFLRFSPRSFDLDPGESLDIRFLVSPPATLAPGEYRSHVVITPIPDASSGPGLTPPTTPQGDGVDLGVNMSVAFAIPVTYRHRLGPISAQLSARRAGGSLSVDVTRQGARGSLYGTLELKDARGGIIAREAGVAIYGEIDRRTFTLTPARAPAAGSALTLVLVGERQFEGQTLAQIPVAW